MEHRPMARDPRLSGEKHKIHFRLCWQQKNVLKKQPEQLYVVFIQIYIYIYTYVHIYIYTYIHIYIYICIFSFLHAHCACDVYWNMLSLRVLKKRLGRFLTIQPCGHTHIHPLQNMGAPKNWMPCCEFHAPHLDWPYTFYFF